MSKRLLAVLTLVATLGFGVPSLMADHGNHGQKHHGNKHFDNDQGENDNDQGWERRDGYEYRTYGDRDGRPEGWDRGKKTGWGNCGLPPGQAKKYGCRMYMYQNRPHYYYQDEAGRIFVRRPSIDVHVDIHN